MQPLGKGGRQLTGLKRSIGRDGNFLAWSPLAALSRGPSRRIIDCTGDLLSAPAEEEGAVQARTAKGRGDLSGCDDHCELSDKLRASCLLTGFQTIRPSICRDGNLVPGGLEMSPSRQAIDSSGNFLGQAERCLNWPANSSSEGAHSSLCSSDCSQCDIIDSYSESIASAAGTEHHGDSQDEEKRGESEARGGASCIFEFCFEADGGRLCSVH